MEENGERQDNVLRAFATILKDNWEWRKQIGRLALFELVKRSRGAVLSWFWLFAKPLIFICVFWFALDIGLRAGKEMDPPFFLWLIAGLIPWFYMQDMLGTGSDILHRFPYLVNKIKFPLSGISTIYCLSTLIVHLGLMVVLFIIYFAYGMSLDLYLVQIPLIIFVMCVFFNMFSILTSQISAVSKDFANLLKAANTPIFWLSGIIYNVEALDIVWVKNVLMFNPVTFFATAFRSALYEKTWVWENTVALEAFGLVFFVTLIVMLLVYKRFHEEVSDAL